MSASKGLQMPISEPDAHLTTSEAQALAAIVSWSAECPAWQRDALRRLCEADKLYADDIDALLTICKSASNGEPLTADHVRDPAAGAAAVTLKRLHSIQHVNALVANERLTFDKIGVTVIYGDNGSGKSGYARALKKFAAPVPRTRAFTPISTMLIRVFRPLPSTLRSMARTRAQHGPWANLTILCYLPSASLIRELPMFTSIKPTT
jgi:hypothetical protein